MDVEELYTWVTNDPWKHQGFIMFVALLKPKHVLELGTGAGNTAARVMKVLDSHSRFTTINWPNPPSGDPVGVALVPWAHDLRLKQILGDTRDPKVVEQVEPGVDLMFIDSGTAHEYALISEEWRLYRPKLVDGALVVCDDIGDNDMHLFWDALPYEKRKIWNDGAGMFIYEEGREE